MRTAEEIITEAKQKCHEWKNKHRYNELFLAIQIARKEVIEECAGKAEREINSTYYALGSDVKNSILLLIDELK